VRAGLYTWRRSFKGFLFKYKKIKRKFFWKFRNKRWRWFLTLLRNKKFYSLIQKKSRKLYKKKSQYSYNRRIRLFKNFKKIWKSLSLNLKGYGQVRARRILFPYRRKIGKLSKTHWVGDNLKWIILIKKKKWYKLRKRWIWHRLIKRTVKVKFLNPLKKYFAFNIAVRKCFKNIVSSYKIHKKILFQKVPFFLVNMGLVSIIKQAYKICKRNRIIVNGKIVNNEYIIQPYDLVTFDVRKMLIWFKYKRWQFRKKRYGTNWKVKKGLLYNKRIRTFIFYKNIFSLPGTWRSNYHYYYYYRNLLQTCRMR